MTMGADPVACAALAGGAEREGVLRAQGGQGPRPAAAHRGPAARCRRIAAWSSRTSSRPAARRSPRSRRCRTPAIEICGVISVLDRLAGGGAAIERAAGAPYVALSTIDEVYPDRPDRAAADRLASLQTRDADPPGDGRRTSRACSSCSVSSPTTSTSRDELQATEQQLREALFGERPAAEALIAERGGQSVGYALFFATFSSFLASQRRVAGGSVRAARAPRRGRRPGAARGGRRARARPRRRAPGVVGARLERARARLLSRPRRATIDEWIDPPPRRRGAGARRGGIRAPGRRAAG